MRDMVSSSRRANTRKGELTMSTMTAEEKKVKIMELKGQIGQDLAVIKVAEQGVQDLKVQAAPKIAELIKLTGKPGPFGIPVPGQDGSTTKMIASFRKDGKTYATSLADSADLD